MKGGEKVFYKHIGQAIRHHRELQGMTQEDLGVKTGFSQSYIAKVETGRGLPSIKRLEVFAKALGVEMNELWKEGEQE